jgi:recombination protein RecA
MFVGEDILAATETYMKTGEIDLIVIDSVSSLIPKVAADSEIEDVTIALLARLMSKTLLRFTPIAAQTNTCVIFINQIRNKIGVMMGNPETTTGGLALGFYATGRVRVSGVGAKANRIIDEKGVTIGHKTKFEVIKNRLAAPFTEAEVNLIYGIGYDIVGEVIKIATDLGILTRSGSWYSYGGDNIGQGENGVRKFFDENPDIFIIIKKDTTDILGLTHFYEAQKAYDIQRENKDA